MAVGLSMSTRKACIDIPCMSNPPKPMIPSHKNETAANRIKRITESVLTLPTLPTVVSKMIEMVDNPKTSAASLARLISTDQALTARILKLANSAYYGFSREISTVNMAIVILGFNSVKEMGLSLSVLDVFRNSEADRRFDVSQFWEHSIACGVGARMLARKYYRRLVGEAFVAGLLHDLGKIIVNQYAHEDFTQVMSRVAEKKMDLDAAEREVLGTGHSRIGGWLAEKWRLPSIIVDTIHYHHCPWDAPQEPAFIGLIGAANYLCHYNGIGNSGRAEVKELDERMWTLFEENDVALDASMLEELSAEFLLEYDQAETFVSFIRDQG